ncbi:MAG: hypothetical protein WD530_07900, partial [Vicingaceae bacterium]
MLKLVLIIFLSVLVSSSSALAQEKNNFSQKQISLQKENIKLGDALLLIADKANFNLSFNPHILPDSTVSFNFHNQTSRNIFAELLPTYIQFEAFGESIILQKMQKPKHKKITISGEIKNAENNKPLSDALIVEASGLASTFTDENGRFQLKIKKTQTSSLSLSISKENFKDTLLILPVKGHNILLSLWKKQLNPLPKKDYHLKNIPRILVPKSIQLRTENIQTHIYRKYQLSLLPGIGTNLKMSGVVE